MRQHLVPLHDLEPIGHRIDGTPIFAYFGADGEGDDDGDGGDGGGGDDDGDDDGDDSGDGEDDSKVGDDGLTAKGRKALSAERAAADRARQKAKPWLQLQRELGMTPEQIREALRGKASGSKGKSSKDGEAEEVDADEIRRKAQHEAQSAVNAKLVKSSVRAAAAGVLADPKDAVRFLDLSDYEVDEDGEVDEAQIKRDLRALLRDKPYLAAAKKGDGRQGGSPNFDGGSRRTSDKEGMSEKIRRAAGVIK